MKNSLEQFTSREISALNLIVEGKTNKEIAAFLNVSLPTAKTYVQKILDKTGIHDRKRLIVEYQTLLRKKNSNCDDDTI
jgi:DNA-binding NarL/FixJ family response regulator